MGQNATRVCWRFGRIALVAILALAVDLVALRAVSRAEPGNAVAGIRALGSTVELTVTSSVPFPVRTLPPVLSIGTARFARSRSPEDGSLAELIFVIPVEDFALLEDGDPIRLGYGLSPGAASAPGPSGGREWDFGTLDKSLLQP